MFTGKVFFGPSLSLVLPINCLQIKCTRLCKKLSDLPKTDESITDLPIEVDKALIEADVPFQNVHARAEKSLKSVTSVLYYFCCWLTNIIYNNYFEIYN